MLHYAVGYVLVTCNDSSLTHREIGAVASNGLRQTDVGPSYHGLYVVECKFANVKSESKDEIVHIYFKGDHIYLDARRETRPSDRVSERATERLNDRAIERPNDTITRAAKSV